MYQYLAVAKGYCVDFCRSSIDVIVRLCFSWQHMCFRKPVAITLSELFGFL